MAYNTPETVADYLARFQMEITHREKGTFTPDHVKYSLTIASGGKDFFTTFESNPHVHGEPTITQVFGALASDAMVVRDYGMDEFVDEFCDGMKPSAAIRAYNSCKETYDWMRDGLTEDEVREDFTDDEIFNHQMEMKDFDYEEEMRALAAFFNGEKSDMSDFVNPYGGNHILVSGSVGRWNGTSTGIAVYKDFDAATDCSPSRFGQGNVFADCEIQKVWDENGTLYLAGAHHDGRVSVEMRQLTDEGERLWGQLDYEDYLPLEGLTAMGKHYELGDENRFVHDLYNSPELCAAPRYVEQSFGCPSEEYEKEEGTLPHDFTTGKWRVHLIYPGERYGLDGCLTYELNAYSGVPAAAHRASYPLVEFYDTSQDAARFPGGQFVSRYYMTDLLEDDSIAVSLDTMLKNGNQFSLDGGIPAWTVEGDDLAKVNDFLKKSCMEFSGSLPADEKDEDGYSLSGEAKDATASRNGLSRNQMGIEEKAAECKEAATVLANGNAL